MAAIKIDLGPVEALLNQILQLLLTQVPIINLIFVKPTAVENTPYEISNAVNGLKALAEDGTVGFAALEALMVASFNTLVTDIGTTAQSAVQPSWWNTAPSWWVPPPSGGSGAPTTDAIAEAVWAFVPVVGSRQCGDYMSAAGTVASAFSELWQGQPQDTELFALAYDYSNPGLGSPPGFGPTVSVSSILPADTIGTWLNREASDYGTWTLNDNGYWSAPLFGAYGWWLCRLNVADFAAIKRNLGMIPASVSAPVWPGIAGVTLGAPVALSPTCVVTGPMHGVIIDITSAAPRQVYQVFGGMQGYRFVGGLQFVDDNGEAERIQSIGMQHEVIVCKSMAKAASCSIRTDSAVTGTATPFVVT